AICLVNPRGYQAFTVPADLMLLIRHPSLGDDMEFRSQFLTPLRAEFYAAGVGWRAAYAGIALLLVLGVGFGIANCAGRHTARLLVCAAFIALALVQAKHIPFLAVALAAYVPRAWHEIQAARTPDRAAAAADTGGLRRAIRGRFAIALAAL